MNSKQSENMGTIHLSLGANRLKAFDDHSKKTFEINS